jgi:hypothetical protein
MDRRPESNRNGKSELNGRGMYPIVEVRRVVPPPVYSRRKPSLLPLVFLCSMIGLGIALFVNNARQPELSEQIPKSEAFRWAVNRAMSAAELTQTAQSSNEWQQVANWWQEAIKLMQAVPSSDANHSVALAKITEYQNNLTYAQNRSAETDSQTTTTKNLWGVGSPRAMVLKLQGNPTEVDRYDSMCKEVLHYGKSTVELSNGRVVQYEDFDRKFKVAETGEPPAPVNTGSSWDMGSTKEDVFRIQGTPSRIVNYDYSDRETLYYGNSTIELVKQRVVGYNNESGNLRVRVMPILVSNEGSANVWSLDSSREEILQVQGTPTQVNLDSAACSETLYYGNSTIDLKNGFVAGYDNVDRNLRVKTR